MNIDKILESYKGLKPDEIRDILIGVIYCNGQTGTEIDVDSHRAVFDYIIEQVKKETLEEVEIILHNWSDFTCHSRKEHKTSASYCPGWSHEDQEIRGLVVGQIKHQIEQLKNKLK